MDNKFIIWRLTMSRVTDCRCRTNVNSRTPINQPTIFIPFISFAAVAAATVEKIMREWLYQWNSFFCITRNVCTRPTTANVNIAASFKAKKNVEMKKIPKRIESYLRQICILKSLFSSSSSWTFLFRWFSAFIFTSDKSNDRNKNGEKEKYSSALTRFLFISHLFCLFLFILAWMEAV